MGTKFHYTEHKPDTIDMWLNLFKANLPDVLTKKKCEWCGTLNATLNNCTTCGAPSPHTK